MRRTVRFTQQLSLFGEPPERVGPQALRRPRRARGWQLTAHACRHCFGRVLARSVAGEIAEVRCAECGRHADGPPRMLCACGADCGALGFALECFRNPHVTDEVPHEVLVRERRVQPAVRESSRRPKKRAPAPPAPEPIRAAKRAASTGRDSTLQPVPATREPVPS